jgi:hypothetical protein
MDKCHVDNLVINSVHTSESFEDEQHGYYYAYMRLANPDREQDEVIAEVKNYFYEQSQKYPIEYSRMQSIEIIGKNSNFNKP